MSFPKDSIEALAMLYLEKNVDFSKITPSDLLDIYKKTYEELRNRNTETSPPSGAAKRL